MFSKFQKLQFCLLFVPLFSGSALASSTVACGPGAHWVDTCPGGVYSFSSSTTAGVLLDLDRNGTLETSLSFVQFSGVTSVFLGPGQALSPPHSMLTELFYLYETGPGGAILRAGDGLANNAADGALYSGGFIEEHAGDPTLADSFFQVFLELTIPTPYAPGSPLILTNSMPLGVWCQGLTQVPPAGCKYENLGTYPLNLYEGANLRGQLFQAVDPLGNGSCSHHAIGDAVNCPPTPEPGTMSLLEAALALGLFGRALRRQNRA
jgi:hypothetical protein